MPKRTKKAIYPGPGKPLTQPGTPEDAQRIQLSQWITALLVCEGDEPAGAYQTPGAGGYTAVQLAAHAPAPPPVPPTKAALQQQVLAAIRTGSSALKIRTALGIHSKMMHDWRQEPAFLAQYEAALLAGKPHRPKRKQRS